MIDLIKTSGGPPVTPVDLQPSGLNVPQYVEEDDVMGTRLSWVDPMANTSNAATEFAVEVLASFSGNSVIVAFVSEAWTEIVFPIGDVPSWRVRGQNAIGPGPWSAWTEFSLDEVIDR